MREARGHLCWQLDSGQQGGPGLGSILGPVPSPVLREPRLYYERFPSQQRGWPTLLLVSMCPALPAAP